MISENTVDMFLDLIQAAAQPRLSIGYPGRSDGAGGWEIEVANDPGRWWVRVWNNGVFSTITTATPMGVPRDPYQRCLLERINGELCITKPDPTALRQLYQNYANDAALNNLPKVTEGGDKGLLGVVAPSASGGMNVSISAYPAGGLDNFIDPVDLSGDVPGSSGQFLWDVAYILDGDVVWTQSPVVAVIDKSLLQIADARAVSVPAGAYRLYAVSLAYGQTDIRQSRFVNLQDDLSASGEVVQSVVAGTGIAVDSTDPQNPIVSAVGGVTAVMPQGWLVGYEVDYDGTNLTLQPGQARSDSDDYNLTKTSTITINPATTGANGLDSGSLANSTWYYAFVIAKSSDGTIAGLLSTSATAPTMPTGYDQKRRVGCVRTDGSAALFRQKTTRGSGNLRLVQYRENTTGTTFRILNGANLATYPSWTDVDCSALIPPTSRELQAYALQSANVASTIRWREASLSAQVIELMRFVGSTSFGILADHLPVNSSQHGELSNAASVGASFIFIVNGYYDNLTPTIV